MNSILIDTSVWIEYFSGNKSVDNLDNLIDSDVICTNKIILSELIPFLKNKKEFKLIDLLLSIDEVTLNIDWDRIIDYQFINVKNNLNKIGIPDLIILQNVLDNNLSIYTLDKHFKNMEKLFNLNIYNDF